MLFLPNCLSSLSTDDTLEHAPRYSSSHGAIGVETHRKSLMSLSSDLDAFFTAAPSVLVGCSLMSVIAQAALASRMDGTGTVLKGW